MSTSRKTSTNDRLSSLPDKPLLHILSFVDAKIAVQASVLGRRWRYLWTRLPVLNFNRDSFSKEGVFDNFVPQVLSHRDASADLHDLRLVCPEVECDSDVPAGLPTDGSIVEGVINQAQPMGIRHLSIVAYSAVNSVTPLHAWQSLTTLELTGIIFEAEPPEFNLVSLKKLLLDKCAFLDCKGFADPFRRCLNLRTLHLVFCFFIDKNVIPIHTLEISAPQLTDLTVSYVRQGMMAPNGAIVISTPKLASFSYLRSFPYKFIINVELSFIKKVNIDFRTNFFRDLTLSAPVLIELLERMRSAEFLTFSGVTIEVLETQAGLLKDRPSPFTGLKKFECVQGSMKFEPGLDGILPGLRRVIPPNVMRYILGGSRRDCDR